MRVAVTGSSGYVGSHLAEALTGRGMTVLRLARRQGAGTFVPWKLGDAAPLADIDVLVHCAYDFTDHPSNLTGTRVLYDAAKAHHVRGIVHISSLAAFTGCRSVYGRTKLQIEHETTQSGGISIRAGTVWGGAKQGGPMGSLESVVARLPIVPRFTGCGPMRLVHIDDLTNLVGRVIEHRDRLRGAVIAAASPDAIEFGQLLAIIAQRAGLRRLFVPVPAALVQPAVQFAERFGARLPLRADSIQTLRFVNEAPDLSLPDFLGANLRTFIEPGRS